MNLVRMTGPTPQPSRKAPRFVWDVAVVDSSNRPLGTVYRVTSFRRALALSGDMARDRRLHLWVDAQPR